MKLWPTLSWGLLLLASALGAQEPPPSWRPAQAPLMTPWAAEVGPTNALPEYPRPQLVRPDWLNLNGLWDYAISPDLAQKAPAFAGKILVPFPVESALSGVMTNLNEISKLWYHRTFAVPEAWRKQKIRLHFGAVDWRCQVKVNGRVIGSHQGGYDAFTFDITEALLWNGAEDISVCVTDPTEGNQPRGKQLRHPEGIYYTANSGIWQTVWLEPVPVISIDRVKTRPDVDAKAMRLWVGVNQFSEDLHIEAVALVKGREVAQATGLANTELTLNLPNPHLWSPSDPFLYDLKITLKAGDQVLDSVTSYFGMRKIALRRDDQGITRITLNDQFLFQVGTLDQGYWPDGIYTAPTDAALRSDIEFLKKAGFNFTRKHVKVEPARWYYWCDKLGLMVWQDMPSSGNNATVDSQLVFENELFHMVDGLGNHPAIIVWVLFNEGWGQYDTEPLTAWLKKLDPTRLVDNASGWTDMRVGDLRDMHSYPGPDAPAAEPRRASVLGEFGGMGMAVPNHLWSSNYWGYLMLSDKTELAARYGRIMKQVWDLHKVRGLSAAVYTQTTDVETECNGLKTYDRAVTKIEPAILASANRGEAAGPPMKTILANALAGGATWRFTTFKPANDWLQPGFDPANWKVGAGGFGALGTPGFFLNTIWDTSDIWLRREFTLGEDELTEVTLQIFHDEETEVYLNGVLAAKLFGFTTDYDEVEISKAAAATLHPGQNTIAVHCHQTTGGQGIDVGLLTPQKVVKVEEK